MSYFFATLGKCSDELKAINDYFDRTTKNISKFSVKGESVNVQYYGEKKVLEDVYIRDDKTGSWLLILGMPVCDLSLGKAISLEEYFSDPKTILNSKIDGHFCLLAFNGLLGRLLVATDSNSFIPVYYKELRDGLIISSSELALAYSTDAEIDQIGFAQSISLGVVWGNRTRFNGIKKLRACEILSTSINGEHSVEYYWHPEDEDIWREPNEVIISRWAETAGNGLQSMVKSAGTSSVSADITGGEDSRIVLALCHSLGIPVSSLRVRGFPEDADVRVAKDIAGKLEIPLNVEQYRAVDVSNLCSSACDTSIGSEGYGSIFSSLTRDTTDRYYGGHRECTSLHLCGVPGGEAYRGSYYLRAKLWSPASMKTINIPFFARMKFLLDYLPDLFELPSGQFLEVVYDHMSDSLNEVRKFPSGIKVDHLLRTLQTCVLGLNMRQPFYFPLGLRDLTKTIYSVTPTLKRGGRLTKACTEQLYPDLAWIKTQKGVPTVRRTLSRSYLFSLGYYSQIKSIVGGVSARILHRNQDNAKLDVGHLSNYHAETMRYILTQGEGSEYFRSRDSMVTGYLYNDKSLSSLLMNAKTGRCNYVETLGRVINAELAMQYISKKC